VRSPASSRSLLETSPTLPSGRDDILVVVLRGRDGELAEDRLLRWQARLAATLGASRRVGARVLLMVNAALDAPSRAWLASVQVLADGLGVDLRISRVDEAERRA
jgi:hypothetical protein